MPKQARCTEILAGKYIKIKRTEKKWKLHEKANSSSVAAAFRLSSAILVAGGVDELRRVDQLLPLVL